MNDVTGTKTQVHAAAAALICSTATWVVVGILIFRAALDGPYPGFSALAGVIWGGGWSAGLVFGVVWCGYPRLRRLHQFFIREEGP